MQDSFSFGDQADRLSDCSTVSLDSQAGKLLVYKDRFLQCLLFCMLTMMNQMLWMTYVPISDLTEGWLKASTSQVNWLAIIWMVLYLPGTYLCILIIDRYDLRTAILVAGGATVGGAGLRVVGAYMRAGEGCSDKFLYATQLTGQALCGLVQAILLNLPANLSAAWFGPNERDISTMFASVSGPLGNAIGSFMPALLVPSSDSTQQVDHHMATLLLIQFLMCVCVFIPCVALFKSAPPTPPSESERLKRLLDDERNRENEEGSGTRGGGSSSSNSNSQISTSSSRERRDRSAIGGGVVGVDLLAAGLTNDGSFRMSRSNSRRSNSSAGGVGNNNNNNNNSDDVEELAWDQSPLPAKASDARDPNMAVVGGTVSQQLAYLAGNTNYLLLFAGVTIALGIMNLILSLVNQIVEPYGYSNDEAGWFNAILLCSGLVGAGLCSLILEKTKRYEEVLKGCFFGCMVGLVCVIAALDTSYALLCFSFGLLGFFVLPLLPCVIEVTAETTYPYCSEDVAVGALFVSGNITGAAYSFFAAFLLEREDSSDNSKRSSSRSPFAEPSNIFLLISGTVMLVFIFLFEPTYERLRLDQVNLTAGAGKDGASTPSKSSRRTFSRSRSRSISKDFGGTHYNNNYNGDIATATEAEEGGWGWGLGLGSLLVGWWEGFNNNPDPNDLPGNNIAAGQDSFSQTQQPLLQGSHVGNRGDMDTKTSTAYSSSQSPTNPPSQRSSRNSSLSEWLQRGPNNNHQFQGGQGQGRREENRDTPDSPARASNNFSQRETMAAVHSPVKQSLHSAYTQHQQGLGPGQG